MESKKKNKKALVTQSELIDVLTKIALGTNIRKVTLIRFNEVTKQNETFTIDELPTHADQIVAAEKMIERLSVRGIDADHLM